MNPSSHTVIFGESFDPISEDYAVVEFFSTGCPPCRRAIPGLNSLQKECPNVKILQISTEDARDVVDFFSSNIRDRISFTVACVPSEEWSALAFEIGLMYIPRALVLRHGVIHYLGHPASEEFEDVVRALQKEYESKNRSASAAGDAFVKSAGETDELV